MNCENIKNERLNGMIKLHSFPIIKNKYQPPVIPMPPKDQFEESIEFESTEKLTIKSLEKYTDEFKNKLNDKYGEFYVLDVFVEDIRYKGEYYGKDPPVYVIELSAEILNGNYKEEFEKYEQELKEYEIKLNIYNKLEAESLLEQYFNYKVIVEKRIQEYLDIKNA
jgi:hypothetical protein